MKLFSLTFLILTLLIAVFLLSFTSKMPNNKNIYDFKLKTIDGQEISLLKYKGKKILLVNVASECGYTPQYKNLQDLHEKFGNKVIVIGIPANNFGGQEPGTNSEIKTFCSKNYGVTFLMMDKINVIGTDIHPLYEWLSNKTKNGVCSDTPTWNFCKYLIDENGKIIKFFSSKTDPLSKDIISLL